MTPETLQARGRARRRTGNAVVRAVPEAALDDRRKEVREAALDLPRRLPGSALGTRMAERARHAVRFERPESAFRAVL